MTVPKYWARGLSPDRRSVLAAGRKLAVPAAAKQAVWSGLALKLPEASAAAATGAAAAGASGTTAAGASGTTAAGKIVTTLSLTKVLALGFSVGATVTAGVVGYRALSVAEPARLPAIVAHTASA